MNKKKLIETIKKISQELTDAPGIVPTQETKPLKEPFNISKILDPFGNRFNPTSPVKTNQQDELPDVPGTQPKPSAPKPAARPASFSIPAVKKMQKAILDFANAAAATDVTALQGNQQGQMYGDQSRNLPYAEVTNPTYDKNKPISKDNRPTIMIPGNPYDNEREYLGGSDPFGKFIIQNYIPKDILTGKQYLNTDVAGNKNRETHSMQPTTLRGIIDSMKRIGSPGSSGTEKSIDGIWQTRTNNALHIMIDLVSAMQNFITDMKIKVPGYTVEQLDKFKSLVPKSYTELKGPAEIKQRAEDLTPEIVKMTKFFENLKPTVFNNQQLRQYIDQKTPFTKYEKRTEIPEDLMAVEPSELAKQSFSVNSIFNRPTAISLIDLSNMDLFKNFLEKQLGIKVEDRPEVVKSTLDRISQELNAKTSNKDPGY